MQEHIVFTNQHHHHCCSEHLLALPLAANGPCAHAALDGSRCEIYCPASRKISRARYEPLAWQTLGLQIGLCRPLEELFDAAELLIGGRPSKARCQMPLDAQGTPKFRSSLTLPRPTRNSRMSSSSMSGPADQPWCTRSWLLIGLLLIAPCIPSTIDNLVALCRL
ncbi:hypothetical protein J3F83DRAFT_750784 [Trichoderma novae-zelandiae]